MRVYLSSLNPRLSRAVWTLQHGSFANAFGNGMVFPFLPIYLHTVRGCHEPARIAKVAA